MATKTVTLYPSKIDTASERSTKTNIQKLSEKENLKSGNNELAYWGVKKPTWKGNYLRNYPDSLTSISGSFYKPAEFTASGFKIAGADKRGQVKNIWIEYKWEQVSYSSTTAFGSFDKPVIKIKKGSKVLDSITGAKPEKNRYNNCKKGACLNTNSANLATKHSHKFSGVNGLTVGDLAKNVKILFHPAKNTSHNHLRIIMQFFRIIVEYTPYVPKKGEKPEPVTPEDEPDIEEDIQPNFEISLQLDRNKAMVNEEYYCTVTVKNTVPDANISDNVEMLLDIPSNTEITPVEFIGEGDISISGGARWMIDNFVDNVFAQVKFLCKTKIKKDYAWYSASFRYSNGQNNKASAWLKILSDAVQLNFTSSFKQTVYEKEVGSSEDKYGYFTVTFSSEEIVPSDAKITIDTNKFITTSRMPDEDEEWPGRWVPTSGYRLTETQEGVWVIDNIQTTNIILKTTLFDITENGIGDFTPTATYKQGTNKIERQLNFTVVGGILKKEYFKLRLEDGSDVQYNELTIHQGNDLTIQPTYTTEDMFELFENNLTIIGETKRLSTHEAKYISFDVYLEADEDITYENVITYIDVYDEEYNCDEIIVGTDSNIELFYGNMRTYCIIKELQTNVHNTIKFIVQSDEPREAILKIKPLNYDKYDTEEWKPARIYFKDIPNIQIGIKGPSELIYRNDAEAIFKLQYTIQNKSNIKGEDIKFKLSEPNAFMRDIEAPRFSAAENAMFNSPTFNIQKRTIYFPELDANSPVYTLEITYKATKKGIYEFAIETLDYSNTIKDDQYRNIYKHKILTNVTADLDVKTKISNPTPYLNDIIDYTIEVANRSKRQENLLFDIYDIGHYDVLHKKNDYTIIEWDGDGVFEATKNANQIGAWTLTDVAAGETNKITISLQPKETGVHVIKTMVRDKNGNTQKFENHVQIFEPNKKIDLNVYQAINQTDNENCCNPDILTEICDDDFISIGDEIYYVIDVINNEKVALKQRKAHGTTETGPNIKVKMRLPMGFVPQNCHTQQDNIRWEIDSTGLITLYISRLPACSHNKFCIKVIPEKKGKFITSFILSARNTKTISKSLNLTVDSYFNERKTEHEITIYNFEKTNRYFRYELDGDGNLFKFFNKGDISKRTVDTEKHTEGQVETYKGSTLKKLVDKIKENSKYVEPELLRIGSNHLKTKGYELYPNGFINRFGLLNSEVYHYTGQLPQITNLIDYAMKWDVDEWDQKLWSGDIYQNGVFDLTVNYGDIPTNFNILELSNPLNNLQALVDRVKPFGTKAICYFSFDVKFELRLVMDLFKSEILADENFNIKLEDMELISWYNRHDNSVFVSYDMTHYYMKLDNHLISKFLCTDKISNLNIIASEETDRDGHTVEEPIMEYCMDVFTDTKLRQYIADSYDIVENLQATSNYIKNITISKEDIVDNIVQNPLSIKDKIGVNRISNEEIYNFYFDYDINDDEEIGIYLETQEGNIYCKYYKDKLTSGKFELIHPNGNVINTINKKNINKFKMQVQCCIFDNRNKIIHFWCAINELDYEYLGYYIFEKSYTPMIFVFNNSFGESGNNRTCTYTYIEQQDTPITFSIDDNYHYDLPKYNEYYQVKQKYQWKNLNKLGQQPITIQSPKESDCEIKTIQPPMLMFRYDKFDIENTDEIQDIYFDIKSNKTIENLKVGVFKDGTYYLPKKGIMQKTYFPHHIDNVIQEYNSTISIQQPNITICSNCLKTSLGYYNQCPHCNSEKVTHQKEKTDVTICYNCGWVEDGWYNKCVHCLSKDVIRTLVDYNKTYCYNCQSLHDDYYNACPYCFSTNIIHLQNDVDMYRIYNQDITNIEPIVIQSDIQGLINVCNLTIPLNKNSKKLNELEELKIIMEVNNNNLGEYYYCDTCETAGLGNYERCPYCNESNPEKYHIENLFDNDGNQKFNLTMYVSATVNGETKICEINPTQNIAGTVEVEIPILDLARENNRDYFTLSIDAENTIYKATQDKIKQQILKYGTEYIDEVFKTTYMDMSINNFYLKSKFINENLWDISRIEGDKRKGITYYTDTDETNYLSFHFNVDLEKASKLLFRINGINNSLSYAKMNIKISTNKGTQVINTFAKSNLFEIEEDIYQKSMNLKDINVQVNFYDVKLNSELIITDCYLIAVKETNQMNIPDLEEQEIIIDNYSDKKYKISSSNMWGVNNIIPKYLTGQMLDTSVLACFEFDKLDVGEIFKIYDINMVIVYKNKFGNIVTGTLPITEDRMITQMVNADVVKRNGENWGAFKVGVDGLNNLESEIINTDDERFLDSIPLLNSISQSFKPEATSLYKVKLRYAGKTGYPNDYITVSIYDDFNNQPDVCLASQKVVIPSIIQDIEIDFFVTNLKKDQQYWLTIEDKSADEFNYHKFKHNTHKEIGNLYIKQNGISTQYDHIALCFAIENGYEIREFIEYPHTCELDTDINTDFKLYDSFYRFDAQTGSNVYLSNLLIKSGYKLCDNNIDSRDTEEIYEDEMIEIYPDETTVSESLTPCPKNCEECP